MQRRVGLKKHFTLLLLACFAFSMARGFCYRDRAKGGAPMCGHGCAGKLPPGTKHTSSNPCASGCVQCVNCLVSSLTSPDPFWISLADSHKADETDWSAWRLTYPPPLPPPRMLRC